MLRELHFGPCEGKHTLKHLDTQGHVLKELEFAGDTTCCTLPVKAGQTVVLDGIDFKIGKHPEQGPIKLVKVIGVDVGKEVTICPASVVPVIEPSGTPPEKPKLDVASMTPAQKYKAGLRPVRVDGQIVWQ